ncbi:hypothetical protein GCM10025881_11560 [Pseudolysinimonas kribbensis]|uniref:Uncharacterized protein n=1 Tax=Pseudolysinimonas kribbensis TaxID=433641 RepID=A0ABQ6K154_9MICO|nr:hypothetical protein GCM10025881_11560 [Pseudolysinimonas kribbensis]
MDLGRLGQDRQLRDHEGLAEALVEPLREVAGELEVLALILADGHDLGVVEQHVGGHEHRVDEQANGGGVRALACDLVLVLRHPARLAVTGDGVEHPGELGVRRHVRLHEQGGCRRVDPGGDVLRGGAPGGLPELRRFLRHRDRVQVDDAEEGIVVALHGLPLQQGADVVAGVQRVGARLHAREQHGLGHEEVLRGSGGQSW